MKSDVSSISLQKNSDFVYRFGIPFFESLSSENTFFACWQQNRAALSFISEKKSVFAENFFLFKKPEFKFYGKQIKTCILCYKAEYNVFSNEKEKGCFL